MLRKSILIAVCAVPVIFLMAYFYSQPNSKIIYTLPSPDGKWVAETEVALYGTFGGANYSLIVKPQKGWFNNETIFSIGANPDQSQPFIFEWLNQNILKVTIHSTSQHCVGCSPNISRQLKEFQDISVTYENK